MAYTVKKNGYLEPRWLCQLRATILASLSTGNDCYLLYILNGKHINKLIASFQMISKVYV